MEESDDTLDTREYRMYLQKDEIISCLIVVETSNSIKTNYWPLNLENCKALVILTKTEAVLWQRQKHSLIGVTSRR